MNWSCYYVVEIAKRLLSVVRIGYFTGFEVALRLVRSE